MPSHFPPLIPSGGGSVTPAEADCFARRHAALETEIYEKRAKRAANAKKRAATRTEAFAALCEATEGLAVVWRREGTPLSDMLAWADGDVLTLNALARWWRLTASREIDRLRHAERRPFYYEQEKARRQALAAERRKVSRRTTTNPCPTKEQVLDAWEAAQKSSEGVLRFGSLMEDLACYADASLIRTEDGAIVGRRGGIKAWLQVNIPALYLKYKTVMAYKAAARKLKQITGLVDPTPAERLAESPRADEPVEVVRARAVYLEVMGTPAEGARQNGRRAGDCAAGDCAAGDGAVRGWPRSRTAWLDRIEAYADPERVTEATTLAAWRVRYESEITVRTKSEWVERLKVKFKTAWRRTG